MTGRGAYGLDFHGLPESPAIDRALIRAPSHWPAVRMRFEHGATGADIGAIDVDDDFARLELPAGGDALLDRSNATATLTSPAAVAPDWLVHPALAFVASVFAGWLGHCRLHAGAFVAGGGAWAVVGGHEAGKSSTLGWLATAGHPVLADDMLVLDGRTAFAGPQTIDLRREVAGLAPFAARGSTVRAGHRRRLAATCAPAECPLRGFFVLSWSDAVNAAVSARRLPAVDLLGVLVDNLHPAGRADPQALFDLLDLPAYEVSRPQTLDSLPATADELVRVAGAFSPMPQPRPAALT